MPAQLVRASATSHRIRMVVVKMREARFKALMLVGAVFMFSLWRTLESAGAGSIGNQWKSMLFTPLFGRLQTSEGARHTDEM